MKTTVTTLILLVVTTVTLARRSPPPSASPEITTTKSKIGTWGLPPTEHVVVEEEPSDDTTGKTEAVKPVKRISDYEKHRFPFGFENIEDLQEMMDGFE